MKSIGNKILVILRILGIILGISFLVFQIFSSLRGFNWPFLSPKLYLNIILGLAINIFGIVLQMTAWKIVLEGINQRISLLEVFSGFSLSFVARLIPGTIWGYLTRGEWLKHDHGIPYAITNFGSVVETSGYLVTNLLIALQGLLFVRNIPFSIIFIIIFLIGSWAFLNLLILWNPARQLFRMEQNKILRFPLPKWIAIFFLCIGMWYCYGLGLMIFANAINFQITFLHALEITSVYALAWFTGFIVPFIPSGIGLREYFLTVLLVAQFGMAKADASFIAIGFRVLLSIAELLWIAYGLAKKTLLHVNKKITL